MSLRTGASTGPFLLFRVFTVLFSLFFLFGFGFVGDCVSKRQVHIGTKLFIVFVLDDLPNLLVASGKLQGIDGARIRWKPVDAVNLLAVGFETGE